MSSAASSAIWNPKWEDHLIPNSEWSWSIAMLVHKTFATYKKRLQPQICRWLIWLKSRSQIGDERRSWVNLFFCIWAARSPPLCCHLSLCLTKWSLKMTAAGDWKRWIWIKSGVKNLWEFFCFYTSETSSRWSSNFVPSDDPYKGE